MSSSAAVQTYIGNGFLNDGQGFQSEEVHLDKSRIFDDGTFVLGNEHLLARLLIIRRADGYPIRDVVTANNSTAGMHTRTAYITFQHLGIFHRIAHQDRAKPPQPAIRARRQWHWAG